MGILPMIVRTRTIRRAPARINRRSEQMTAKLSKCPICHSAKLKLVRSNFVIRVQERNVTVPKLERFECTNCGQILFDYNGAQRLERASKRNRSKDVKLNSGEMNKLLQQGEKSIEREGTLDSDEASAARRARRQMRTRK